MKGRLLLARDEMLAYFKEIKEKRVVITFHSLADVDAVGSAFALKSWFPKGEVVAPDTVNSHAKKLMKHLGLELSEYGPPYEGLIVLDTHSRRLLGRFAEEKADIVIDHHMRQDSIDAKHAVIDNGYCSTSEIVYGILKQLGRIDRTTAICLLAGMVSDSAGFKNANSRMFGYIHELMETAKIGYDELLRLVISRPDISQRVGLFKAAQGCSFEKAGDYLIVTSKVRAFESLAAEAFVDMGADVAFVAYSGDDARISARMRVGLEGKLNLAKVMAEAGKAIGGSGGGHEMAAGANGSKKEALGDALGMCVAMAKRGLDGHEKRS